MYKLVTTQAQSGTAMAKPEVRVASTACRRSQLEHDLDDGGAAYLRHTAADNGNVLYTNTDPPHVT